MSDRENIPVNFEHRPNILASAKDERARLEIEIAPSLTGILIYLHRYPLPTPSIWATPTFSESVPKYNGEEQEFMTSDYSWLALVEPFKFAGTEKALVGIRWRFFRSFIIITPTS